MRSYSRLLLGRAARGAARHAAPHPHATAAPSCTRRRLRCRPRTRRPATASRSPSRPRRWASTSPTRARRSTPKLAHIMPQVASMGAGAGHRRRRRRRPRRPLRHQQQGRLEEPAVSQQGRRHVRGHRRARRAGGAQPARHRRLDGQRLGRLRQRRLRGRDRLQVGQAGAVPQRRRQGVHVDQRPRRPAGLGQHQRRRLARLRSRRQARSVPRRLLRRAGEPLEARQHEDDAGELRVRQQRRPQVPVSQSRRRALRGSQREGRPHARGGGRWRRSPRICATPAIPTSSSPTTTASRSCSSTRAASSARSARRAASATRRRAA